MSEPTRQDYERAAKDVADLGNQFYHDGDLDGRTYVVLDRAARLLSAAAERMTEWTTATPTEYPRATQGGTVSDRDIVERLDWSARMTRSFAIRYLANDAAAEIRRRRGQVRVAREALFWITSGDRGTIAIHNIARVALAQLDTPATSQSQGDNHAIT